MASEQGEEQMVTISADLRKKMERRARRAWRGRRTGSSRKIHRITAVTDDRLNYRVPEPGYYLGTKNVVMQLNADDTISYPQTRAKNGLASQDVLDLKNKFDVKKLLNYTGRVRAYKRTKQNAEGDVRGGIKYVVGETVEEPNANTDPKVDCGAGINLACWSFLGGQSKRYFAVEFDCPADLAAVPDAGGGKFRVFRCLVVEELDYVGNPIQTKDSFKLEFDPPLEDFISMPVDKGHIPQPVAQADAVAPAPHTTKKYPMVLYQEPSKPQTQPQTKPRPQSTLRKLWNRIKRITD